MKRFATALVLLALTLTMSIGAQFIFSKKTGELITDLKYLLAAVDAGEGEEQALDKAERANGEIQKGFCTFCSSTARWMRSR